MTKTHTLLLGHNFSSQDLQIKYNGKVGYIILFCDESVPESKCDVISGIIDEPIDYDTLREYHNEEIRRRLN